MRHVIQTALVFDSSQPKFLLIEYDNAGVGRCVGEYLAIEDAIKVADARLKTGPRSEHPRLGRVIAHELRKGPAAPEV